MKTVCLGKADLIWRDQQNREAKPLGCIHITELIPVSALTLMASAPSPTPPLWPKGTINTSAALFYNP